MKILSLLLSTLFTRACFSSEDSYQRWNSSAEVKHKQSDAERVKNGKKAALAALKAMSSEECDWKVNPLSLLRGEPCGKYYKILGLTRQSAEPSIIKKKYREKSKLLHPDKNPSQEANEAFTSLTEGYSCLLDESCKHEYDNILEQMEEIVTIKRLQKVQYASSRLKDFLIKAHYYVTYGAAAVDQVVGSSWEKLGSVRVFDVQVGRILALVFAAMRRKGLLVVYLLSKAVLMINEAIIRSSTS